MEDFFKCKKHAIIVINMDENAYRYAVIGDRERKRGRKREIKRERKRERKRAENLNVT